jgi:hypothetical protein
MLRHEAKWAQAPEFESRKVGQYYCPKCKLQLLVAYNEHYLPAVTGWYWRIVDGTGKEVESAGNEHVTKYEPDIAALEVVRVEGLKRFDAIPCRRSN